jgi:hypothetical protein
MRRLRNRRVSLPDASLYRITSRSFKMLREVLFIFTGNENGLIRIEQLHQPGIADGVVESSEWFVPDEGVSADKSQAFLGTLIRPVFTCSGNRQAASRSVDLKSFHVPE